MLYHACRCYQQSRTTVAPAPKAPARLMMTRMMTEHARAFPFVSLFFGRLASFSSYWCVFRREYPRVRNGFKQKWYSTLYQGAGFLVLGSFVGYYFGFRITFRSRVAPVRYRWDMSDMCKNGHECDWSAKKCTIFIGSRWPARGEAICACVIGSWQNFAKL